MKLKVVFNKKSILVRGKIRETDQWSMVTRCKLTDFQLENSSNINPGVFYNQFIFDRDSCSDLYSYDVAPGQIYP